MTIEKKIYYETLFFEHLNIIKEKFIDKYKIIWFERPMSIAVSEEKKHFKFFYNSKTGTIGFQSRYEWINDHDYDESNILFKCSGVDQDVFYVFKECLSKIVNEKSD